MPRKYTRRVPLSDVRDSRASGPSVSGLAASTPRTRSRRSGAATANPNPEIDRTPDSSQEPANPVAPAPATAAANTNAPVAALQIFAGAGPPPLAFANVAALVPPRGLVRAAMPPVSIFFNTAPRNKTVRN